MKQRGFSSTLIFIAAFILLGFGVFLYKYSSLSLPIKQSLSKVESLSNVSVVEQQINSIPNDKRNQIDCAILGFAGGTDSQGYYKEGGHYVVYGKTQTLLSPEETTNLNRALLTVISEHPPKYNPDMKMCLSESDNLLLIERGRKSDSNSLFVLQLTKEYELKKQLAVKVENQLQGSSKVLAYTKEGVLYLWAQGQDSVENIYKIDFNSQKVELAGRGSPKPGSITSAPSASHQINKPSSEPIAVQIDSAKRFKKGTVGAIEGTYFSFIQSLPDENLIAGFCVLYRLNSNNIYESMDRTHPRYGGFAGMSLDSNTSQKLMKIISNTNRPTNTNIFYCDLDPNNKVLNILPEKGQNNRTISIALLDGSLNIKGDINLKFSSTDSISSFDPEAFTKDRIFYLKLSGQLDGANVKLFKINFNNSSYETLYQGK